MVARGKADYLIFTGTFEMEDVNQLMETTKYKILILSIIMMTRFIDLIERRVSNLGCP